MNSKNFRFIPDFTIGFVLNNEMKREFSCFIEAIISQPQIVDKNPKQEPILNFSFRTMNAYFIPSQKYLL